MGRTKQRLLATVLLRSDEGWYLNKLAREFGVTPSTLQRDLEQLVQGEVLQRVEDGGRVYYEPHPACSFLPELRGLLLKTVGLVDLVAASLLPLAPKIQVAFIYGSIAAGEARAPSDVDLFLVGEPDQVKLSGALSELRDKTGREVNPVVIGVDELRRRADEHFVSRVLDSPKLFVVGNEGDLEEALGPRASRPPQAKP